MLLYLVNQIVKGALGYAEVIAVRPEWKESIDLELTSRGLGSYE